MKKIKYFLLVITFFVSSKAASVTVYGPNTATVGQVVTYKVVVNNKNPIVAYNYSATVNDSSTLVKYNNQPNFLIETVTTSPRSLTFTFKYQAKKVTNNASFTFTLNELTNTNVQKENISNKTVTKNLRILSPKVYSNNNFLKALTVKGKDLKFDKNKTNYDVEVEYEVETLELEALKEDSAASLNYKKTSKLKVGENKINVEVIAENGSSRVYTLNIIRKDAKPIIIEVKDKKYTLVREKTELDGFTPKNAKYKDVDIFVYNLKDFNEDIYLLKDDKKIYKFTLKDEKFIPFYFLKSELNLIYIDEKLGKNFEEILINDELVKLYKKDGLLLFKGKDIKSGKINTYNFDKSNGSIQKVIKKSGDNNRYKLLTIILSGVLLITNLAFIIVLINNKKYLKKITKGEKNGQKKKTKN